VDLNLTLEERSPSIVDASYTCPCGCHPTVAYERGARAVMDTCCCGNEFAVGADPTQSLNAPAGSERRSQVFDAPWGQPLTAVWAIGPSTHEATGHEHPETGEAHEHETVSLTIDPVCGMTVDTAVALAKGLHVRHAEADYYFCGKGCKLEFIDTPDRYLDPSHVPSM
jgi:YHS domain-containing protein